MAIISVDRLVALIHMVWVTGTCGYGALILAEEVAGFSLFCKKCPSNHHCNGTACTPCTECPPGHEVTQACTLHTDTVCDPCPANTYSNDWSSRTRCSFCTALTCPPYLHLRTCTPYNDASCDVCGDNYFFEEQFNRCMICKPCSLNEVEVNQCTFHTNRACQQKSVFSTYALTSWSPATTQELIMFPGVIVTTTNSTTSTPSFLPATTPHHGLTSGNSSFSLKNIIISISSSVMTCLVIIAYCTWRRQKHLQGSVTLESVSSPATESPHSVERPRVDNLRASSSRTPSFILNNETNPSTTMGTSAVGDDFIRNLSGDVTGDIRIRELDESARKRLLQGIARDCSKAACSKAMRECFQQSETCRKSQTLDSLMQQPCPPSAADSSQRAAAIIDVLEKELDCTLNDIHKTLQTASSFLETLHAISLLLSPSSRESNHGAQAVPTQGLETSPEKHAKPVGALRDVENPTDQPVEASISLSKEAATFSTTSISSPSQLTPPSDKRQRINFERKLFYDGGRNFLVDYEAESDSSPHRVETDILPGNHHYGTNVLTADDTHV